MTAHPQIPCKAYHPPQSRPARGVPFDPASMCRPCWLFVNDERYHALWTGLGPPVADSPKPNPRPDPPRRRALPSRPDCRHLGPPTGEVMPCAACGGRLDVAIHGCALRGQATRSKLLPGVECCRICKDYDPCPPPPSPPP
jgi:hypothetical protein